MLSARRDTTAFAFATGQVAWDRCFFQELSLPLLEDGVDYGAAYFALDAATRGGHASGFGELALDFGDAQGAPPRETESGNFSIAHIRITFLVNPEKTFFHRQSYSLPRNNAKKTRYYSKIRANPQAVRGLAQSDSFGYLWASQNGFTEIDISNT